MAQAKKKKELSQAKKIEIGVGLTAAAVAAAGAYFLYGSKHADKNRKKVKSWMLKAKAEVLEKLEDAKEITKDEYETLIATAVASYAGLKNASKTDVGAFKKEMLEHWKEIEKSAAPIKQKVKKTVKKAAKKVSKKPAKKTTKKAAKKTTKKAAAKKS